MKVALDPPLTSSANEVGPTITSEAESGTECSDVTDIVRLVLEETMHHDEDGDSGAVSASTSSISPSEALLQKSQPFVDSRSDGQHRVDISSRSGFGVNVRSGDDSLDGVAVLVTDDTSCWTDALLAAAGTISEAKRSSLSSLRGGAFASRERPLPRRDAFPLHGAPLRVAVEPEVTRAAASVHVARTKRLPETMASGMSEARIAVSGMEDIMT